MIGLALLLLALVVAGITYYRWRSENAFLETAVRAQGYVIDQRSHLRNAPNSEHPETIYTWVVSFQTADGRTITFPGGTSSREPDTHVEVYYDPARPEETACVETDHQKEALAGAGMAGVLVLVALLAGF